MREAERDQTVLIKFQSANICPGKLDLIETMVTEEDPQWRNYNRYNLIAALNLLCIIYRKRN